jgi:hypothetical protein
MKNYITKLGSLKRSDWQQINPFILETYFIHLKKLINNNSGNNSPSKTSLLNNKSKLKNVPSKEEATEFIKDYLPKNKDINIYELIKSPYFSVDYSES